MNRTLLVATSSVGLVVGGAMSASAHQNDHRYDRDWGKGWLTVCQSVSGDYRSGHDGWDGKGDTRDDHRATDDTRRSGYDDPNSRLDRSYLYDKDHGDRDRRHRNDLDGRYLVRDSRGKTYSVSLQGRSDCERIKVNRGWAKVSVADAPDDTRLKSARNVWVKVKRDHSTTVTFSYEMKRTNRYHDDHDHDWAHR